MKKVFLALALIFSIGISSLLIFTPLDLKISLVLQDFMQEKTSEVPVVLVSYTKNPFEENVLPPDEIQNILSKTYDFGATGYFYDSDSPLENIDSFVKKPDTQNQSEKSILGIKIVFPQKEKQNYDSKTPENAVKISKNGRVHLLFHKNGQYYACPIFAKILETQKNPEISVTNSSIRFDHTKIPRNLDGSVSLKFPKKSSKNYKTLSFTELYDYAASEENFFTYVKDMEKKGLFSDLNSENPIELLENLADKKISSEERKNLTRKFYSLMNAFLSGNQERILCEQTSDAEKQSEIKNSFAICRTQFSDLNFKRTTLSDFLQDSFCVFAEFSDSDLHYASSDSEFSRAIIPFAISNMIFSQDFVTSLPAIFSFLPAILFCMIFAFFAVKTKKNSTIILLAILTLLFSCAIFAFLDLVCRIFIPFSITIFSLLIFSIILSVKVCFENQKKWLRFNKIFLQVIHPDCLKKIFTSPQKYELTGKKNTISILSISIMNVDEIRSLLNENQFVAILNHYFELTFKEILAFGGIIESYEKNEIVALFGALIADYNHCENSLQAAFRIQKTDEKINEEIRVYPSSPKIDGMSDDLYTAFFILNQNKKKISSQILLATSETATGSLGAKDSFTYKIIDDTPKILHQLKKCSVKYETAGIILNEAAAEILRNDFIIRKIKNFYELLGDMRDDDEKLWNYTNYWNQAIALLEKDEKEKALAVFRKLSAGRPNDKVAKHLIKSINSVE